jgi:hypothetical protein
MQQSITELYQKYVVTLTNDTFQYFTAVVQNTNRNCFHLASLNRYQRCFNTMEYMFEELGDVQIHLDGHSLEYYNQVNACFHREEDRIDPRLYEDTIPLI